MYKHFKTIESMYVMKGKGGIHSTFSTKSAFSLTHLLCWGEREWGVMGRKIVTIGESGKKIQEIIQMKGHVFHFCRISFTISYTMGEIRQKNNTSTIAS